jgi:hypothetical protein
VLNIFSLLVFTFLIYSGEASAQENCPPEVLSKIATPKAQQLECKIARGLYQPDQTAALIVEFIPAPLKEGVSEDSEITVSLWPLKSTRRGYELAQGHPVYRESQLGQELLTFIYQGQNTRLAFGDFNQDGRQNFAILTYQGPHATLIIKGLDQERAKFESLGHRSFDHGVWSQFPHFISGKDSSIEIKANAIEIQTQLEKMTYTLRGSQYEIIRN